MLHRKKNCVAKEPYLQWVKDRVQDVKLLFILKPSAQLKSPKSIPISIKHIEELKITIQKLKKENEELQIKLDRASQENKELKWENAQKEKKIEGGNK